MSLPRAAPRRHPGWQTALVGIGIAAVLSVLGALFVGFGAAPVRIETTGPVPAVGSTDFAAAMAHLINAPIGAGGTVDVLNNGDAFLAALIDSVDEATVTINVLVFIWEEGAFSDRLLESLLRRQRSGVSVRVLLDGLGARDAPRDLFRALEDAGGRVERFRTPTFGTLTRFHRRNHRRAIIVDGEVGFTGGMAVGDQWLGNARHPAEWRDMMFRITGPLAHSLQAAFVQSWVGASGEVLLGRTFYPAPTADTAGVRRFTHLVHSPADDSHSMAYFHLLPILAARERVYVATPYFVPDEALSTALQRQARAGVDVRLLLPGSKIDTALVRYSAQSHYEALLEAGVRIFEYQPTFMHGKIAVIDGQWSIFGSPNLNFRSRTLDEENAFGILDETLARTLEGHFLRDLAASREIELGAWQQRGLWTRLLQFLSTAVERQS